MLANPTNLGLIDIYLDATNRYGTKMSPWNEKCFLHGVADHVINPTNSRRALDDGVEHRLHVRRRTTDKLSTSAVAVWCSSASRNSALRLPSLEEPHVLDGDHRLIGECFEQSDLPIRKRPNF